MALERLVAARLALAALSPFGLARALSYLRRSDCLVIRPLDRLDRRMTVSLGFVEELRALERVWLAPI